MRAAPRGWGEVAYPQQPAGQYTVAALPPVVGHHHHAALHHPNSTSHYQGHSPYEVAAVVPTAHMQHLVEQQAAEEMRKSAKRAANRRSASTCRARKKFLVETMAEANDRMRRRSMVLSLLPDMILAMRRDGVVTYASDNCREFLDFKKEEVEGANMFDLVESGSHNRLRRLLEENLGSVSKEAIASALRHQGTTFESLLARAEKAKEQGDSSFFSASGEAPRFPGLASSSMGSTSGSFSGSGGGSRDMDGSTDDWESEVTSSAEGYGRTGALACSTGTDGGSGASEADSGGAGGGEAVPSRAPRRRLPPLGRDAFSSGQGGAPTTVAPVAPAAATVNEGGGNGARRHGGSVRSVSTAGSSSGAWKAMEGGSGRGFGAGSEASGECGGGNSSCGGSGKAGMVNIDRDLQSKINAFTSSQKDLCKLEIMREDKKFEWYEVRSSMRLAWLKAKQEIVPVEVICSFQQMHRDSPAGSANSIVARLQRVAAKIRTAVPADSKGGDHLSTQGSLSSGFSASGESNGPETGDGDGDGDLRSEGEPSRWPYASDAVSSSDYGGGTSSGSVSGDGNSAVNNGNGNNNSGSNCYSTSSRKCKRSSSRREEEGGGAAAAEGTLARKRPRSVSAPLSVSVPAPCRGNRLLGLVGEQQRVAEVDPATGVATISGKGNVGPRSASSKGDGGEDDQEQGATEGARGVPAPGTALTASSPTARRLALSAKKMILFRHGYDSQSAAGSERS